MNFYFAHAGEVHDAVVSTMPWYSKWYLVLPAYVVSVALITYLAYRISRRSVSFGYNVLLSILLVSGMVGYRFSSAVSVLSLSVGFAMALLQVLFGLGYKRVSTTPGNASSE
jgi:hypothetical protein